MVTIQKVLGVVVKKYEGDKDRLAENTKWVADAKKLPGSPPLGYGATKMEAKFDLLAKLMWERGLHGTYGEIIDEMLEKAFREEIRGGPVRERKEP